MISVVIPSYNRKDCVLALLADVYRQEGVEFEVIVVDDCSPDGSYEAISEKFPQVVLLKNEKNGGPCVTRNRGVLAAKGEIIVGFDSDVTVPDSRFLAGVKDRFSRVPGVHGLAFHLLKPDGKNEDVPRWWHPLPVSTFATREFLTSYFSGTGYAFRRDAMIAAGLFPEIFYMHYEEVELAFRILDRGGDILYCPELCVQHHANEVSRRSEIKVFYKPRNQILLAIRCYPFVRAVCYATPRVANSLLTALRNGWLKDFVRAMKSAAALAPQCLADRSPLKPATWRRMNALLQK
jgi:GT2 family glycosyltransferase